jgi:hypothetical protein
VELRFAALSTCKRNQILAFALYRLTWLKTAEIARLLDRSPAGVSLARRRIQAWIDSDESLAADWRSIEEAIRAEAAVQAEDGRPGLTPAWYREALSRFPLAPVKRKR